MTRRTPDEAFGRLLDFSGERIPYPEPPTFDHGVQRHIQRVNRHITHALNPALLQPVAALDREAALQEMVRLSEELGLYDLDG